MMRDRDQAAKMLESIEKKAKRAVVKDDGGLGELSRSTDTSKDRFVGVAATL